MLTYDALLPLLDGRVASILSTQVLDRGVRHFRGVQPEVWRSGADGGDDMRKLLRHRAVRG